MAVADAPLFVDHESLGQAVDAPLDAGPASRIGADGRVVIAELGNPYARIGADTTGRVGIEWGVYGLPETFVIDKQGRIRYRHVGPVNAGVVREMLRELDE